MSFLLISTGIEERAYELYILYSAYNLLAEKIVAQPLEILFRVKLNINSSSKETYMSLKLCNFKVAEIS